MFIGFPILDGTSNDRLRVPLSTLNSSNVIADADSLPVYRIYGPGGAGTVVSNGTGSFAFQDTGTITGAANNGSSVVRITSAGHGLQTGDRIAVASVGGTTEANGTWTVTVHDANTFDLNGSSFVNAYTSGGSWHVLGLYYAQVSVSTANGYQKGKTYTLVVTYAITSTFSVVYTFTVV
jgi:hypothetical protein